MTTKAYIINYHINHVLTASVKMDTLHDAATFATAIVHTTHETATITYPNGAIAEYYVDNVLGVMVKWVKL